jgi:hypothetical protein
MRRPRRIDHLRRRHRSEPGLRIEIGLAEVLEQLDRGSLGFLEERA